MDHCGRKDFEETSVSNRCYGKDWKMAAGCGCDCSRRVVFVFSDAGQLLSQRSEETSVSNGIPSATHLPATLAIPCALRERAYSCKSRWNFVDRTCPKKQRIYNAELMGA